MFMQSLENHLNECNNRSVTENGAVGYKSTGKALLDLNFFTSSLRSANEQTIIRKFDSAFQENPELALKWLFFARDIRGGMGERRLFRVILRHLVDQCYMVVKPFLKLVPEYGRWDDLWCLLDSKANKCVAGIIREQLAQDMEHMKHGKPVSLLAKWLPSAKGKHKAAEEKARKILQLTGMSRPHYNKTLSALRRYIDIVERRMSAQQWESINYEAVPSKANLIYNKAFLRHDESRRRNFLAAANRGEVKVNSAALFPYEIVSRYNINRYNKTTVDENLEAAWKNLPDTVQGNGNTIVVADGSASMSVRVGNTKVSALNVAESLAIYFAEHMSGEFKDKYITFSMKPQLVDFSHANTLANKLDLAHQHHEAANTNIEAVFDLILGTALANHMSQEDLPKNILIISDMEFDSCVSYGQPRKSYWNAYVKPTQTDFQTIADKYRQYGYKLPRLVFWNVCSRTGTIPVKENELGVALVSGFSQNVANMVLNGELDPYQNLVNTLMSERYSPIKLVS